MKQLLTFSLAALLGVASASAQQLRRGAQVPQDDQSDRPNIDVSSYSVEVTLVPDEHRLVGKADIQFKQLDRKNYAVFDIDRRLRVEKVTIGGSEARIRQFDVDSTVEIDLSNQQFNNAPVLHIEYSGILNPEEDRHEPVLARVSDDSAFLLYGGKWFPTNGLYRDKAVMRLKVNAPAGWTLVTDLVKVGDTYTSPQQSYWGTLTAGKYNSTSAKSSKADITIDTLKAAPDSVTPMAEAVGKMFDYFSERFGPITSKSFRIVEVQGANWNAQSSVGMLLVPAIRKDFDADALAFAVAHQWFPMKFPVKDSGADAWLADGMAQFAALTYFEKTLSPAEAQPHIHTALVRALGYEGNETLRQGGTYDKDTPEYRALVQYKGAYVVRMLRWVIGDEKFDQFLLRYQQQFQNTPVSTDAFEKLASDVAGGDLGYFFEQWVNSTGAPEFKVEWTEFRQKNGYKIDGTVKQDLDLFRMPVEFQVVTDGDPEYSRVEVVGESSDVTIMSDRKPKAPVVVIDPKERILRMSPDLKVAVVISRGEDFANEGQYNSAIDEFQKALDIDGNNSLALFRMGEALFELGNLQAAAQQFQQALNGDLKAKWVEVWSYINRGKIFDIRGNRDRAVSEYQKAINTGDDSYGAQGEAEKYSKEPYRRAAGKNTIG